MKPLLTLFCLALALIIFVQDAEAPPKLLMNYSIMGLYLLAILWWLFIAKRPWDAAYWCAAFAITFVVTFGYSR